MHLNRKSSAGGRLPSHITRKSMSPGTCCSQAVLLLLGLQVHQILPLAEIQLLLSASFAKMAVAPMPIRYTHKFIFLYKYAILHLACM